MLLAVACRPLTAVPRPLHVSFISLTTPAVVCLSVRLLVRQGHLVPSLEVLQCHENINILFNIMRFGHVTSYLILSQHVILSDPHETLGAPERLLFQFDSHSTAFGACGAAAD